jgi:hypothetical protein
MSNNSLMPSRRDLLNTLTLKKSSVYPALLFILLLLMFWMVMIFQNANHQSKPEQN